MVQLDARGKPVNPLNGQYRQATPHEKGAAVEMYFDGLSYRRPAENMEQYFGRETWSTSVYRWVRELKEKEEDVLRPMKLTPAACGLPMRWWSRLAARIIGFSM